MYVDFLKYFFAVLNKYMRKNISVNCDVDNEADSCTKEAEVWILGLRCNFQGPEISF